MAACRLSTLNFRIEWALQKTRRTVAGREHRSVANMVAVMIRDYCGRNGNLIPERQLFFGDERKSDYPESK